MKDGRCKTQVWSGLQYYQCARKATHGEYCWQHDPAKVEERRKESERHYREKMDNSPESLARKLAEQKAIVEELKAENEALKAQLSKGKS